MCQCARLRSRKTYGTKRTSQPMPPLSELERLQFRKHAKVCFGHAVSTCSMRRSSPHFGGLGGARDWEDLAHIGRQHLAKGCRVARQRTPAVPVNRQRLAQSFAAVIHARNPVAAVPPLKPASAATTHPARSIARRVRVSTDRPLI
jgi:hypothetical protein